MATNRTIRMQSLRQAMSVFRYIGPYRWAFIGGMIMLVMGSVVFMVFPWAAGEMANVAIGKGRFGLTLWDFALLFAVILVVQGLLSYLRILLFAYVSEKGMAHLRTEVFSKLITLPVQYFDDKKTGELTSYITTDVERLQSAFSVTLAEFLRQIIIMIVGVVVLIWIAPRLTLWMLLTFPVVVILAMVFGRYIKRFSRRRQDSLATANHIVEEAIQHIRTVKAFVAEWMEMRKYRNAIDSVVQISLKFARVKGLFFIFIVTFLFGALFLILWLGAWYVSKGMMDVGDLFAFVMYTAIMGGAIAGLGNLFTQLSESVGAAARVLEILEYPSETPITRVEVRPKNYIRGDLHFEDVHFAYPSRPDVEVLKGVRFTIEEGQKVALVGPSGAGKTTLTQLILRFYRPTKGTISINGRPIEDFPLTEYRAQLAVVPQEVMLFSGTIEDNIRYGNPQASIEEVRRAAELANAMEFIERLPEGLRTYVGDKGFQLSAGQRQRIAIARAILKNPRLLILDEATSSLDAQSEHFVQEALERLMQGRTSIIIAHRLSTILDADKIIVLQNGRIVQQGTHAQLLSDTDGLYYNLYKIQATGVPM